MRYQPHEQFLETHGHQESVQFTIAATGKAFRNLMDGLYSRKIEAVIREICTNAFDSHTEAGYPGRRFHVSLPTHLRRMFAVRDFGVGMPHEQVMERYSQLFDSTKDQRDDVVGMLGLGSKSPFAYTDGFTLRCWSGWECRTYSAYLGHGGVPTISLVDRRESEEERGVEVAFPVKSEDVTEFENVATRVLCGFPFPPEGIPDKVRSRLNPKVYSSGDRWAILEDSFLSGEFYALQGCVFYPLELSQFLSVDELKRVGHMSRTVVLDFDVGSLNFVPSREALSYDDHTKASLRAVWDKFANECSREIEKQFENCDTDWEIALRVGTLGYQVETLPLFRFSRHSEVRQKINDALREAMPRDDYWRRQKPGGFPFSYYGSDGRLAHHLGRRSYRLSCGSETQPLLFVKEAPHLRDRRSRILAEMERREARGALVVREECEDEIDWAKYGNPPVLDPETLPPVPRAKVERSDYVRYVRVTRDGDKTVREEDEDFACGVFLFVRGDSVVRPHVDKPVREWSIVDHVDNVTRFYLQTRRVRDPQLFLIRMRGNEKYQRFRKHKMFERDVESLADTMTDAEVRLYVSVDNDHRFRRSYYDKFLGEWRSLRNMPRTPIDALERFYLKNSLGERRVSDSELARIRGIKSFLSPLAEERIFERARALGVEVLPYSYENDWRNHEKLVLPLLSWRWEKFMTRLRAVQGGATFGRRGGRNRDHILRRYVNEELRREAECRARRSQESDEKKDEREKEGGSPAASEGEQSRHQHRREQRERVPGRRVLHGGQQSSELCAASGGAEKAAREA